MKPWTSVSYSGLQKGLFPVLLFMYFSNGLLKSQISSLSLGNIPQFHQWVWFWETTARKGDVFPITFAFSTVTTFPLSEDVQSKLLRLR